MSYYSEDYSITEAIVEDKVNDFDGGGGSGEIDI